MKPLTFAKAIRRAQKRALEDVIELVDGAVQVEDAEGKVLIGDGATGQRWTVDFGEETVGWVIGGPGAEKVASLAAWIYEREREKRDLAAETLGRYKELSLLYEMGEQLSRQLDLMQVARVVVENAQRHLGAAGAALYLHDPRRGVLEAIAWVGPELGGQRVIVSSRGIAGRVLSTGRAEFIDNLAETDPLGSYDEEVTALICAPLRVGDKVFGVLRLWMEGQGAWSSGDLKLVSALAANASSSISAAQLHAQRVREMSLMHQLERHVSTDLLQMVYPDAIPEEDELVVACCDLRQLIAVKGADRVEHLVHALEGGVVRVIGAFLQGGGVVDTPQGQLVLGLFSGPTAVADAVAASHRAIDAVAGWAPTGLGSSTPGVGIATAAIRGEAPEGLYRGINNAAVLQSESEGRLLVDQHVASALAEGIHSAAIGTRDLPGGPSEVFEVHR